MPKLKKKDSEALDMSIVYALKSHGKLTFSELAKKLHVSPSTVYNRVAKLERKGVIKGYTVVVDRTKSGRGTGAILLISIDNQASIENVSRSVSEILEVEAVYEIGGEADIVALLYAPSIEELRKLVNDKINSIPGVSNVTPLVIMKTYKENGSLF